MSEGRLHQALQEVRVADISMGGARLRPGPHAISGESFSLSIDSVARALTGSKRQPMTAV